MTKIDVAKDFARYPFGRYRGDGPYSGQRFREDFLERPLREHTDGVLVILDGASGMGSSFLEEAFGGLVRAGISKAILRDRLHIETKDATRRTQILRYIEEAKPLSNAQRS